MKKIIYKICLFVLFFCYLNVNAVDKCTTTEMTRLKELANNVVFNSTYQREGINEEEQEVFGYYKVEVLNLNEDLRIYYKEEDELNFYTKEQLEALDFYSNKETFYIYSYTDNLCTDELLKTITVKFPNYNDYYYFNKEKCEDHSDFKYCQEFLDEEIDESFEEIDELYDEHVKENIQNIIQEYVNNYIWYIVGGCLLLVIIIIIIVITLKKHKENKEDI